MARLRGRRGDNTNNPRLRDIPQLEYASFLAEFLPFLFSRGMSYC